jgi:hypothetical protein
VSGSAYRSNSKRVFVVRRRDGRVFLGAWRWSRNHWRTGGIVFRVGELGHVQFQQYRMKLVGRKADGRRGRHGVTVSWWGVRGRRRKRSLGIFVDL